MLFAENKPVYRRHRPDPEVYGPVQRKNAGHRQWRQDPMLAFLILARILTPSAVCVLSARAEGITTPLHQVQHPSS